MAAPGAERRALGRTRISASARRDRIRAAAVKVFAERGYVAASMAEIARRAGIVPSVIYDHFGSKRELAIDLLREHGEKLIARSVTEVGGERPQELLRGSIEAFYRFVEEDPFVWRFLFRDPPADAAIAGVHREIHDRATAGIAALIAAQIPEESSLFGIDPQIAAWMLAKASQEANQGVAEWWWEHREVSREQVVEFVAGLLWKGHSGLLEALSASRY